MALDPRISLGVQPMQLADPLAQYGKVAAIQQAQNQNALAQYQLSLAQREEENTNALNKAYQESYNPQTGEISTNLLRKSLATGGFGAQLPAVEKTLGELELQKLTRQKTEGELFDSSMKQLRNMWGQVQTPEQALAVHDATHKDPIVGKRLTEMGVTDERGRQQILEAAKTPESFREFVLRAQLGAEKFAEMNKAQISTANFGNRSVTRAFSPLTGATVDVKTDQIGMSPDAAASNAVARARLAFDVGQAAPSAVQAKSEAQARGAAAGQGTGKPVFKDGQWVMAPTDMRAGEIREVTNPVAAKDAKEALALIDQATKLIPKATGSYFGNLMDTVAQSIGVATGGAKATAQLQALEGMLVSKMPKMSGPQSDKDVALYKQMAGNIGNPNTPAAVKQEAIKTIKEIQQRYAGIPSSGSSGVDMSNPLLK